jgi:hypothetical protein
MRGASDAKNLPSYTGYMHYPLPYFTENVYILGRKARLAARLPVYGGQATIDIYIKKDKNKIIYIKR